MKETLQIGFIPLIDAATLLIAVDKGFTAAEGLDVSLVREVSWSNVRDKLNIGLFDAAHLLAPVAIASSLGLGHIKVPIVAPFCLGVNGNAITVSPGLYAAITALADGDPLDPAVTARALARVVARRHRGERQPLDPAIEMLRDDFADRAEPADCHLQCHDKPIQYDFGRPSTRSAMCDRISCGLTGAMRAIWISRK